jgi:hypothetical protein
MVADDTLVAAAYRRDGQLQIRAREVRCAAGRARAPCRSQQALAAPLQARMLILAGSAEKVPIVAAREVAHGRRRDPSHLPERDLAQEHARLHPVARGRSTPRCATLVRVLFGTRVVERADLASCRSHCSV